MKTWHQHRLIAPRPPTTYTSPICAPAIAATSVRVVCVTQDYLPTSPHSLVVLRHRCRGSFCTQRTLGAPPRRQGPLRPFVATCPNLHNSRGLGRRVLRDERVLRRTRYRHGGPTEIGSKRAWNASLGNGAVLTWAKVSPSRSISSQLPRKTALVGVRRAASVDHASVSALRTSSESSN